MEKLLNTKRRGVLVPANLSKKSLFYENVIQNIAKSFSCRFLPHRDFGFALSTISIYNSVATSKTFSRFMKSLSLHFYHLLSILRFYAVFSFLTAYLHYKAGLFLAVSMIKSKISVWQNGLHEVVSSTFLKKLIGRGWEIELIGKEQFLNPAFLEQRLNYIKL